MAFSSQTVRPAQVIARSEPSPEPRQFEKTLTEIAQIVSTCTGQQLFDAVVCYITKTFGYYCAGVAELDQRDGQTMTTLSYAIRGSLVKNISFELKGTPCEQVVGKHICYFPSGLAQLFPEDPRIREQQIDSFIGVPLFSASGQALGLVAMCDQKPLENEERAISLLTILAARVATDLDHRRSEIERRELEAQLRHAQKLESLGILAGGIAHDFNNLLVGVLGNAALALSDLPPDSPVSDKLRKIKSTAERAAELTNQLLAYSGKGKLAVHAIDLSEVVHDMGELLSSIISKKARIRYECEANLPATHGDPTQIRQVIMNLITNASDALAGKPGEIVLRTGLITGKDASRRSTTVGAISDNQSYVFVEVTDNGGGMTKETVTRMFDPFFTTKFAGRGLGLSVVLGIMIGHHGAVQVETNLGSGTAIRVLLPISDLANVRKLEKAKSPVEPSAKRHCGTVLVVDDEPSVREVTSAILIRHGYSVLEACDGVEALALFEKHQRTIDAALVDMTMPRMGGDELFHEIRKLRPDVPVLLVSGYSEHEHHESLAGGKYVSFIQKPFQPAELVRKLEDTRTET